MSEKDTQPVPTAPYAELAARLAILEEENAALRSQVDAAAGADGGSSGEVGRAGRHRGRAFASIVLILLGALLAPAAIIAHWAQRELTDTDRYVATIGPLADDPAIQSAIANRLTEEVVAAVDVEDLVAGAVTALEEQGLPPRLATALGALEQPIVTGVTSFVHDAATRLVESDAFTSAWEESNRIAHQQMVAVMRGEEENVLQIGDEGQLVIQLSGLIERLKDRLVEGGFGLAASIPAINATFTLVENTQLVRVQNAYRQVVLLGTWLPWLSLAFLAAGVLVAVRRPRAIVVAGLSLAAGALLVGSGLYFGRILYLDALSARIARLDAAEVVFDQIVTFIRLSVRTVGVLGLLIALAGYLGGGSESARSLRSGVTGGLARLRGWGDRRGVSTGPVGDWLFRHRSVVRAALISLAVLVLLLAATPTPALVLTVGGVTLVVMAILELVARPPARTLASPEARTPAGGGRPA